MLFFSVTETTALVHYNSEGVFIGDKPMVHYNSEGVFIGDKPMVHYNSEGVFIGDKPIRVNFVGKNKFAFTGVTWQGKHISLPESLGVKHTKVYPDYHSGFESIVNIFAQTNHTKKGLSF